MGIEWAMVVLDEIPLEMGLVRDGQILAIALMISCGVVYYGLEMSFP